MKFARDQYLNINSVFMLSGRYPSSIFLTAQTGDDLLYYWKFGDNVLTKHNFIETLLNML